MKKLAKDIPSDVERYVKEHKEQGNDEAKAWALAWSRYCEYKNPSSEHCKKDEYFEGRKDAEVSAASDLNKSWGGYSTFRPMRHALQERDQQTLQREWFDGK